MAARRYAHKACCSKADEERAQDLKDKIELEEYIKQLLKINTLDAKIQKQLKKYIEEYKYTYSGIHKALKYFYEIKGNNIEKANGGIGIVPYTYSQAFNYYLSIWQAQQRNVDKDLDLYLPKVEIVVIPRPQARKRKKTLFDFLDTDEEVEE